MPKFGQKCGTLTCKSGTFMCYTYGQKVWKFHGERSCDKMPGEDDPSRRVLGAKARVRNRPPDLETRNYGRSTSSGSISGSESECSSQPSPLSESSCDDVTTGFLSPQSPREEDLSVSDSREHELARLQCPPPSPVEVKNKVDIKVLSSLINSLLNKHTLVQRGLDTLRRKPALALRLQQRRPRKVLADQGIIPPLKSPATYYEQIQKLERARTGDFLNKKMQDRPERESLVQKHILEDTNAYDSLVAHQKELKKAQLADDLNEKIFFRPGVFELVEKNILPADDSVADALKGGHVQYKKTTCEFEEDSGDAFSPEMSSSLHDQGVSYGSPPTLLAPNFSPASLQMTHTAAVTATSRPTLVKQDLVVTSTLSSKMPRSVCSTHTTAGHPYLMRQSSNTKSSKVFSTALSQRNIRKKKEKPKFKKFKYHQYIPPDQQGRTTDPALPESDSPYSRLLEQQQLYLRLQIMNRQAQLASLSAQMQGSKNFATPSPPPAPPLVRPPKKEKTRKTFTVPDLEEMKVTELKEELKARRQKVTGTKEVLIERLKRYAVPVSESEASSKENITGLINATIQSTLRANTEQAFAAVVNNSAGALFLKARATSPPILPKQDNSQQGQSSATLPNIPAASQPQRDHRPMSAVPMETQNPDGNPAPLRVAPMSNGTLLNYNPAISVVSAATVANSSAPGQNRTIAPVPQFKVDTSKQMDIAEIQKDNLLHKQQKQIEDLKRIVELHRTQLHNMQSEHGNDPEATYISDTNTSSANMMQLQDQPTQNGGNLGERALQHELITHAAQMHSHAGHNSEDGVVSLMNGQSLQMPVKHESARPMQDSIFAYSANAMPPNISLVSLQSGDGAPAAHPQNDEDPVIISVNSPHEQINDPPKYDKAIQMLSEEKRRLSHHSFGSQENMTESSPAAASEYSDVDDLLELLENKGEIPITPTRQKSFPQAAVVESQIPQHATLRYSHFNSVQQQPQQVQCRATAAQRRSMDHLQRTASFDELVNGPQQPQRHSLELSSLANLSDPSVGFLRKDPAPQQHKRHSRDVLVSNAQRRHSGDLLSHYGLHTGLTPLLTESDNDFTNLLVSSAGDILMDSSRVPPSNLQGRLNHPTPLSPEAIALHQEPILPIGSSLPRGDSSRSIPYLNLNDPYATQPFSPMDTGASDGHSRDGMMEDRVRDPQLSSSSMHDSAHSLDKCFESIYLPQSSGSYLRRYKQPLAGASPQRHSHLVKSSSQEILSDHIPGLEHSMQVDELGWLDLTFSSPQHAPPSPMNLQQQHNRASMHSSVGSMLGQDTGSNPYNLSGVGLGADHNEFDLIDSLDLMSIPPAGIDSWGGI